MTPIQEDPHAASILRLADRIYEAVRLEQNIEGLTDEDRSHVLQSAIGRVLGYSPRWSRHTSRPALLRQ